MGAIEIGIHKNGVKAMRVTRMHLYFYLKKSLAAIAVLLFVFCLLAPPAFSAQPKFAVKDDLLYVSFPTEQEGWACGRWGTILHTSNSGLSWIYQKSGVTYTLVSIKFLDAKNGWAVGDGGTIIHTSDGGETWVKQECPVKSYYLMDVHFVDAERGWIVTERQTILSTEDGGKTWQIQFKGEDYILKRILFSDANNGWAVGEYGYIFHTANGGKKWTRQAGSFFLSSESFELITGNYLFDLIIINPKTVLAVGIDGYVTKTVDGGVTWKEQKTNLPKMHLFGVAWDGQGTFVTGGMGALFSSQDEGKSFKVCRVEPPIIYDWIYKIVPRGAKGFVAVGKEGGIYINEKDGNFWKRVE